MDMIISQPHDRGSEEASLNRLAAALGCSPKAFSDPSPPELDPTLELLSLWLAVEDVQNRAMVLALLRNMSGKPGAPGATAAQVSGEPAALTIAMQKTD